MKLRAASAWILLPLLFAWCPSQTVAQSAAAGGNAEAVARAAIQACSERIGAASVGLADVEARCPDVPAALQAAGIRPLIIESSRNLFDASALRQLANLIRPAHGPTAAVATLAPILRGLHAPPVVTSRSWWERFLEWLGEHLIPNGNARTAPSWLAGLLRLLAPLQWLWIAIIVVTAIALVVTAAVMIALEVRAMGPKSVDEPVSPHEIAAAGPAQSRLALLRQLPVGQRPAQLFALLISRLTAAGRLPPDRSLTHREVVRRARLEDAQQRQLIADLARLSERQLYSESGFDTVAGLNELLARGEDLYTTGWGRPVEP